MSTERIIVDESIADEFVALISQRAAALPFTLLGPVVDMKTVQRCNALIDDALNKGSSFALRWKGGINPNARHPAGWRDA